MIYKILVGNEHGGAAVASEGIIKNLVYEPYFNVIFLCKGKLAQKYAGKYKNVYLLNSFEPPIIIANSKFRRLYNKIKFILWVIITSFNLLLFIKKYNVLNIHTTNNHALLIVLLVKHILKSLIVITHWRCVGLSVTNKYLSLLKKINVILCISQTVKESLPKNLQAKSEVVYDGIDVEKLHINGQNYIGKLRKKLNIGINEFVVGSIGTFTNIKGHGLLIDSFNNQRLKNKDVKLILFGSCPSEASEDYLKYLKAKVREYELDDHVFFLMDYDYVTPKNYIVDLDLFVGATWYNGLGEGFGLMYIEAMAQNLPVIAIRVGAAKEIIVDNQTGFLIDSNNSEELAKKIEYAYYNRNLLKTLGFNGFIRARKNFNSNSTILKLKSVYSTIIEC